MPWPQQRRVIGTRVPRLDGPDKATGRAKYSFDINLPGLLHATHLAARTRMRGSRTSTPRLPRRSPATGRCTSLPRPPANCSTPATRSSPSAADTEEHAEDVLRAIRVDYEVLPHRVTEADALAAMKMPSTVNGNQVAIGGETTTDNFATQAFQNTTATAQGTYGASVICHQCLESHGLVAAWDDKLENLTVYASTQAVPGTAGQLAQYFKIPATRVKCITHYMGGGFGSKFGPDIQGIAAAELSRKARAPVKLMLDRAEEVTVGGIRPSVTGTVRIGAL